MRGALISIIAAGVLAASGASAGTPTFDVSLLTPNLVEVSGRKFHLKCIGSGSPTVIFEQGGEGNITNWKAVQPAITAITRTCFYDRPGFGYSDPPPEAPTAISVTDDLRALLDKAGERGPFVFVGHSIGGFYATVYADRFFSDVAGLVLVDPGFAGQVSWKSLAWRRYALEQSAAAGRRLLDCGVLARQGKLTAETPHGCFGFKEGELPEERAYRLHALTRPHWYEVEIAQSDKYFPVDLRESVSSLQEMSLARWFDDLPMVVLSAGITPRNAWETDEAVAEFQAHWRLGHSKLAQRSTAGRWEVVEGAGHFIQRDRPEAVIGAVEDVIKAARARGSSAQ